MRFDPARTLAMIMFLSPVKDAKGQGSNPVPLQIRNLIEQLSAESDQPHDYRSITQDLYYFYEQPLNINRADGDELARLHLLTPYQVHSLLTYRDTYGSFLSLYELPLVYGFSVELVKRLQPFIVVGEPEQDGYRPLPSASRILQYSRKQVMLRTGSILEQQYGFAPMTDSTQRANPNARYRGSPYRMYAQWSLRSSNMLRMGMTMDKDPGETFMRRDNPYGFDFNSFHLFLQNTRWLDKLALGDYDIRYGQGLVSWSGFSLSKSSMVFSPVKYQTSLDPYTSANENNFFRGIAAEKSLGPWRLNLFYSRKRIDANTLDTLADGRKVFSSFQQTGYHRLSREIYDERSVGEYIAGGSLCLNLTHIRLGINAIGYRYQGLLRRPPRPENAFRFSGSSNTNWSLDYKATWGVFYFFGEEALSAGEGLAFLNGVNAQLCDRMAMMVLHRHYDKDYQGVYGSAFSEGPRAQNEQGLYWGAQINLLAGLSMKGYLDTWRFPWLSHFSDGPVNGWDGLLEMNYTPEKKLQMHLRYQQDMRKGAYRVQEPNVPGLERHKKYNIRYHLRYSLSSSITCDNRIEWTSVSTSQNSKGVMVYQDVAYQPAQWPLRLDIRFAFFDTDDYHSRIYAYEDDLLYVFSVPPYYSRGCRTYLNVKYSWKNLDCWCKLARTAYVDKQQIGSGLQMIEGHHKTSLYFQMRLRF